MDTTTALVPVWLTVDQAAARAQVGRRMVYSAARSGRLKAARLGARGVLRFRPEWIDRWCEASAEPQEIVK